MGISEELVKKLTENGVVVPTPIQEQAIPFVMDGKDIIAQAQTGTGKTFAFILPILEKMDLNAEHIQALIVTPTRELALQITAEVKKLINDNDEIDVLAVYGGQDVEKQLNKLKKNIQIVVGTPGRLLDHIRRGTVDFSKLNTLVLDEADQMLHIGFLDEVEEIIKETPNSRQTLVFSATMPPEIQKLARTYMRNPQTIQVEKTQGPAQTVKQMAIFTIDRAKQATLIELIETHRPFLAVIFCRTKRRVSKLYDALRAHGFKCDELHGDLTQAKREQVMKRFRDAEIQLLIATDVAARGLDIEGVTHVYNYDIPQDAESYIHRIGRTGRAGMTGLAITLYASKDRPALDLIEEELNITIKKQNIGNMIKAENEGNETEDKPESTSTKKKTKGGRKAATASSKLGKKPGKNRAAAKDGKGEGRPFSRKNNSDELGRKEKKFDNKTPKGRKTREDHFQSAEPGRSKKTAGTFDKTKGSRDGEERRFEKAKGSRDGEQRRFEKAKGPRDGEQRRFEKAKGPRDGEQRQFEKAKGPRDGEQRRFEKSKGSRDGEQRRFEKTKGSRDGEQRRFEKAKGSRDGEQRQFEKSKGSRDGEQRRFEKTKGSRDGEQRQFEKPKASRNSNQRRFEKSSDTVRGATKIGSTRKGGASKRKSR